MEPASILPADLQAEVDDEVKRLYRQRLLHPLAYAFGVCLERTMSRVVGALLVAALGAIVVIGGVLMVSADDGWMSSLLAIPTGAAGMVLYVVLRAWHESRSNRGPLHEVRRDAEMLVRRRHGLTTPP